MQRISFIHVTCDLRLVALYCFFFFYDVEDKPVRVSRVLFETKGEDGFPWGEGTFDRFWTCKKPKLSAQIYL